MKKYFLIAVALLMMSAGAKAQVTIGATTDPHDFSLLELVSGGERGLRLPQMNFCEHEELTTKLKALSTQTEKDTAKGLQIFNTDTKCVETWNGSKWIQACVPLPKEEILFTINIDVNGGTYYIPTSGFVCGTYSHAYDWNVFVDGVADNTNIPNPKTRTASTNHNGIAITIPEAGTHQIRITPHSCPFTAGWGNAFGYKSDNTGNANTAANKQKLISIDAPLTTMAFAPQEEVGNTSASWMFANIFYGCTNLITPAKIADTYKLPKKITDLSYFLHATYAGNTFLTSPIDLRNISGWFSNNEKITNLSNFLQNTHYGNSNLNLTGQKIFPNWIKTLQGGTGPSTAINDIKDVQGAFSQMFYCGSAKGGDTGEPEFEDDDDPITGSIVKLSDLGNPSTPRYTYRGRTVITSNTNIDDNWK